MRSMMRLQLVLLVLLVTTALPGDVAHLSWAAKRLGIGLSTAYRLAAAGQIPGAFRVGSQWRISKPKFEAEVHGQAS
jgi:excisionase family DNA binding protein